MTTTTFAFLALALVCLALGAWAGLWVGRRLGSAQEQSELPRIGDAVRPLEDSMARVERLLRVTENERAAAHGELREQVRSMHDMQTALGTHTTSLMNALRAPQVRGRWGEMQLRRIVESAGMLDHCDFTEQHTSTNNGEKLRPDLVVHLTSERSVVVDSKVPFTGFIAALDADDNERVRLHREHAKQVRSHMDTLASKNYQNALTNSPEFTVMFLPSDAFLQLALQHQPGLLEHGFDRNIVIATPSTLLALLRTVAHTWRQDTVSREATQILALGRQMHQRLGVFVTHLSKLGQSLGTSVTRYNESVGSLERNVLSTARKLHEAGMSHTAIDPPEVIDRSVRELHAADPAPEQQQARAGPTSGRR